MADEQMTQEQALEAQKASCIFCKIVRGDIPARKVYEDDKVICILDIFPAGKGHLLMLTKEHYPFLPLIPAPVQVHMFKVTKAISKAAKSAVVSDRATIFVANGAIAGQQSPHFLYHIIPRENSDGLDNFSVPANDADAAQLQQLVPLLRQRLGALLSSAGLVKAAPKEAPSHPSQSQPQPAPVSKENLVQLIYSNPELKELIMNNPEEMKRQVEAHPALKKAFAGVDIDKLSEALRKA